MVLKIFISFQSVANLQSSHPIITMDSDSKFVLIHGKNISHNTPAGSTDVHPMSIDNLFPALLECFGIILCGYIAGR